MSIQEHPEEVLITRSNLAIRWQSSTASIIRYEQSGLLKKVSLSPRAVRYRMADVLKIERGSEENSNVVESPKQEASA